MVRCAHGDPRPPHRCMPIWIIFLKDGKVVNEAHLEAKKDGNRELVANES